VLVVSVISLKGGVGKTSVTLGLAGAAWERGLRTLVVDLDPQGNASTVLDPPEVRFTASDVLSDPRPHLLEHAVARSGWGREVDVIAADSLLERHNALAGRQSTLRLRVAMTGLRDYDLVLVDSPPSLGGLTRNALAASHTALVVTEPSLFALQGAAAALEAVEMVHADNLRLQPAGIVVNKLRSNSVEHRYRYEELRQTYGSLVLDPPLPDRAAVQQAEGACVPIQAWRSPGARELSDALEDHLEALLSRRFDDGPLDRSTGRGRA
jgi:cellulose biosynthesis protein BcsQ